MKALLIFGLSVLTAQFSFGQCIDTLNFPNLQPPCYPDFIPVCGCDGVTYRNECYARFATVQQWQEGPCENVVIDHYPNPVSYTMYLTVVSKFESNVNLYIFDRNGLAYYYRYLPLVTSTTLTIPVSGFEQGLYIIMAESNGDVQLSKFIKWNE
ncbi:T9SS type A sorting domain-containing protein [Flavobacteriales bacterium]|nr:T9SS type A sorting domain-containing protein [Flavobacteriales bacterium]